VLINLVLIYFDWMLRFKAIILPAIENFASRAEYIVTLHMTVDPASNSCAIRLFERG
jgi:hypothetical protein